MPTLYYILEDFMMSKDGATIFYFMVTNVLALSILVLFALMFGITGNTAFGFIAVLTNLCTCTIFLVAIVSTGGLSVFLLLAGSFSYILNIMSAQRFVINGDFAPYDFESRDYVVLCAIVVCIACRLIQIFVRKFRK